MTDTSIFHFALSLNQLLCVDNVQHAAVINN